MTVDRTTDSRAKTRTLALIVVLAASFIDLLDVTILNVAGPTIEADLGASPSQLQWIISGYSLAFAAGLLTAARLGDIYGYRTLFLAGVTGFTLTSAAAGLAPNPEILILARIAQGVCAAAMIPQVLSLIQVMYSPEERGPALGAFSSLAGITSSIGPILGAGLIEWNFFDYSWRWIFLINVPVGIVAVISGFRTLPGSRSSEGGRLDIPSALLGAAGLVLIIYPLIEISSKREWSTLSTVEVVAGLLIFVGFGVLQRRNAESGRDTLLPPSVVRIRSFSGGLLTQLLYFIPVMAFFLIFMQLLQNGYGQSPIRAGLTLLPWSVATAIAAVAGAAILVPKIGRLTVQIGMAVTVVGFALLIYATNANNEPSYLALLPGVAIGGAGLGLVVAPLAGFTLGDVPPKHAGTGSGLFNTVAQLGATFGVATVGSIYFRTLGSEDAAHAFNTSLYVAALFVAAALVASFTLPKKVKVASNATL